MVKGTENELRGVIMGYRRGSNTQYTSEVLVYVPGVAGRREASRLIGRRAVYVDEKGNVYRGRVTRVHGNRGVLRASFTPNLPGQAIGREIKILGG
ncbi:MAG: 50S ribosomal protein L35ae [Candidatus Korarchaeota archaeon]|nr:50S ribosomal protein L35ae [Candidatus Korarchaeota archaeon]